MKKTKVLPDILLYDFETNGQSPETDRILEVYIAYYSKGIMSKDYHSYVKIGNNNVDLYTYLKTRWTPDFLNENGKEIPEVLAEAYSLFLRNEQSLIAGYFIIQFDNRFFRKYQKRYGFPEIDFDNRTFDIGLEYKASLLGMYDKKFKRKQWREAHRYVLKNDYTRLLHERGYRLKFENCCDYYSVDYDSKKLHHAKYDTIKSIEVLQKQRPEWFLSV